MAILVLLIQEHLTKTLLYQLLWVLLVSVPLLLFLFKQGRGTRIGGEKTKKLPPGPRKLPIIGNLHQIGTSLHLSFQELASEHGPLMFLQLGTIPTLVISSSEAAREIFKAHDLIFSGRPLLYAAKKLSYGGLDMSFAPYGEYWRQLRKVSVLEVFSVNRVQSFRAVREEEVALLIDSIARSSSLSSSYSVPINLSERMLSLTNNIVCRIVFGNKYEESNYEQGGGNFHRILAETQKLLGEFCVGDFFPWLEWIQIFSGMRGRLEKTFKELDALYDRVIQEHLNTRWPEPQHEDLVHVLLRLQRDPSHGNTFNSVNHVKGLLTDMFIGGTDTSSATLVWAMTELMRNPRVMTKVQQEVRHVVGNKGRAEESDFQKLDYLKSVIKEVLRMHPPAPLLVPRETIEMCRINEYDLPSKTRVFVNARAIAMDPKDWKNPKEFWPERFLGNPIDFKGQDFEFIPFGVGRRSCPGINFATVMVELALANLLYCFDWGLPSGMKSDDLDLEEAVGLTMHKKNPLCLVAKTNHA